MIIAYAKHRCHATIYMSLSENNDYLLQWSAKNMKFPMKLTLVLFIVCLACLIPGVVSAGSQTVVLVSGENTQSAGYTHTQPSLSDALKPISYSGSGIWSPAFVVPTNAAWLNPDNHPFGSGAMWVSSAAKLEGTGTEEQWRLFKEEFNLPAGSTVNSAQLNFTADNAVTVYLNGNEIGTTGFVYGNGPNPETTADHYYTKAYTVSFTPLAGHNTLQFVVRNWHNSGSNPSALLYKATISYTEPVSVPEFPSMFLPLTMIIGFLGAVLIVNKTREN
jgi:hypothetical protein